MQHNVIPPQVISQEEWAGCYDQGWGKNLVSAAYSHPAKVSFKLAERIYAHAIQEGWISSGSKIVDPFGGIGGFGFHALWHGMDFTAVELEPKFVGLGRQNIILWRRKYSGKEGLGSARIIQGDSRELVEVIVGADLICSSPPYAGSMNSETHGIDWTKAKKDYPGRVIHEERIANLKKNHNKRMYGLTDGQLGAMKEGDFDCVIGSPPFMAQERGAGLAKPDAVYIKDGHHFGSNHGYQNQGNSPGQLASLPEGRFEAIVGSPPHEETPGHGGKPTALDIKKGTGGDLQKYGNTEGQLAESDTFWAAAKIILIQCHTILKPGGHAIWVCKDFIRKGKRVPFSDQWQALCESVG